MAYTKSTREKRAKAREAIQAARRQRLEDARADLRSLKGFLAANRRLLEVDVWLDERIAELHSQADALRIKCRRDIATAIADMTARGTTIDEIARMAGMPPGTVRGFGALPVRAVGDQPE